MEIVDQSAVELLEDQFERVGIEISGWPGSALVESDHLWQVELSRRSSSASYLLVYLPSMSFSEASQAAPSDGPPLLVVGDRVSERSARALREAEIQYLDAAGNAYVSFGDVLIDIRARRPAPMHKSMRHVERPTNLFSPRRARVIFALLAWPELDSAVVREIASTAGVSPGLAHETLDLLDRAGYLDTGHRRRLRRSDDLLDYWTAAYPSGLGATLSIAQFAGDIDQVRSTEDHPIYLSGESAMVDLIRPASLTFYVDTFEPRLPLINRWRSDGHPNIFVRQKFWTPPTGSVEWAPDSTTAPWQLVYADLLAAEDSRQAEVARRLRSEHVDRDR